MEIRVSGVNRLIGKLKTYQKSLEGKQRRFLERLAEIGIDTATTQFKNAQYDGVNDVVVSSKPEWINDHQLFITATGESVTFIEFGTGVHYTEQHPNATEHGFVRGAFGQGKGSNDTWGYYGSPGKNGKVVKENAKGALVLTHGNPPARAMYDATKDMRNKIRDIAREVFGSD